MKKALLQNMYKFNMYPFFNGWTRNKAVVFMCHRFCDGELDGRISAKYLEECFLYLEKNNYKVIGLSEFIRGVESVQEFYKTVVFTIDDGYHDFYEFAYPIFKKYNYPAAVFISTDFIDKQKPQWWDIVKFGIKKDLVDKGIFRESIINGNTNLIGICKKSADARIEIVEKILKKYNYHDIFIAENCSPLTWTQILEMSGRHIEFFPHTKTHPILSNLTKAEQKYEILSSKFILETTLKTECPIFCYPNGRWQDFDEETVNVLKESGFVAAFTAEEGFENSTMAPDLFRMKRYSMPNDLLRFLQIISGLESFKCRMKHM